MDKLCHQLTTDGVFPMTAVCSYVRSSGSDEPRVAEVAVMPTDRAIESVCALQLPCLAEAVARADISQREVELLLTSSRAALVSRVAQCVALAVRDARGSVACRLCASGQKW